MHPRNRHRARYDFPQLIQSCPGLKPFVHRNKYGDESVNFFDPAAVRMLNKALLRHYYGMDDWDIPDGYLCPPVPGRADHLHYLADLLAEKNHGKIPVGPGVKCLDIGVGANCIYPIIGRSEYAWSFVGSEIDVTALASAEKMIERNAGLTGQVEVRRQSNPANIFEGIIQPGEYFHLTICNPPFHSSAAEAQAGTIRKLKNLKGKKISKPTLNFGGQNQELWCVGGEVEFVKNMVQESRKFAQSCGWFSTLISKEANLKEVYKNLKKVAATELKTIQMGQGNKKSRMVAWRF